MSHICSLVVICAACVFTGHAFGDDSEKAGTPVSLFEIVNDTSANNGQLREVWVRIERPVPESEVRRIALRIKAADKKRHPKTSITFLLPAMEVNKEAWARAVFRPTLEVTIIGATVAEQEALMARKAQAESVLGQWLRTLPGGSTHTITITKRDDGGFAATYAYPSGDNYSKELVEVEPTRKYRKVDAQQGEFQVIDGDGNLELWDEQGRIETLPKVKK